MKKYPEKQILFSLLVVVLFFYTTFDDVINK